MVAIRRPGSTGRSAPRSAPVDRRRSRAERVPVAAITNLRAIPRLVGGEPMPDRFRGAVIALGNFDGFHAGHQAVAARAIAMAREKGVGAIVATFDPHPVTRFRPDTAPFRLSTLDQRQRLLAAFGVDAMSVFDFGDALAGATPEGFVGGWLHGAGGVVTGTDFHFGRGRAGDVAHLTELCGERGIACAAVGPVAVEAVAVSSSRIRAALGTGDCAGAARLLTRPFTIEGMLLRGIRADPALPLLDASIALGDYLRPRAGLYAVRARLEDGQMLGGSAYLAADPDGAELLELFLVGLASRDVGLRVEVELIAHLHDARGHHGPPALRARIDRDRRAGCRAAIAGAKQRI